MLLLPQSDGKVKLIIQPRRSEHLRVEVGSAGKVGVGGFTLGGIFVLIRTELPSDFFDKVTQCVRPTIVAPNELAWTSELAQLPESTLVQHRSV